MVAVSVPLPPSTAVPFIVKVPTVSLKVLMASVAPVATVTLAALARRSLVPSVSVPLLTPTVPAPLVPSSATVPATLSVPAPRLAVIVPPLSV